MRAVLDTSVLIGAEAPTGVEAAISVASLTELHFGVLVAVEDDERARRVDRLAAIEATFDPLPVTPEVARAWGRLAAAVARRGANPRRRQIDLAIAATATVERVPLLTYDLADLEIIQDLVDARAPEVRRTMVARTAHATPDRRPVRLAVGQRVQVGDRCPEWPAFVFVTAMHGSGWVPARHLSAGAGDAVVRVAYDTTELPLHAGEVVELLAEDLDSGWIWCRSGGGEEGWVPARTLEARG